MRNRGLRACSAIKGRLPIRQRVSPLPADPPSPPPPVSSQLARSRRWPNPPSPSIDHPRAPMAAHWASPPRVSPEPKPQRARRRVLAATTCWGHLRSGHRHQSTCGEPNHTRTLRVYLLRPPFAADKPTWRRECSCVRISIFPRDLLQRRGSFERLWKILGVPA
jgi:hypothetical protein